MRVFPAGSVSHLAGRGPAIIRAAQKSGTGTDPAATAFFAAVVAAGGTVSAGRRTLYNNLFAGLRSDGNLSKIYRLQIYAAENTQSALMDLIALTNATPVLTPAFTADRGYTLNGSTNYIDTNYVPNASSPVTTQNSAFLACHTNLVGGSLASTIGTIAGTFPQMEMVCPFTDQIFHAQINDSGFGGSAFGSGLTTGLFVADRIDASNVVLALNGADLGTSSDASTGVPANSIQVGNPANLVAGTTSRYAVAAIGSSLGSGRAAFAGRIITFLTAIGAN